MTLRSRITVRTFSLAGALAVRSLSCEIELPRLLFLLRRQVLPGLHALQNALLLLRRQAAEALQALPQYLLPHRCGRLRNWGSFSSAFCC